MAHELPFLNRISGMVLGFILVVVIVMYFLKKIKDKAFIPIDEPAFNRENMEYTLRKHSLNLSLNLSRDEFHFGWFKIKLLRY